VSRFQGILTLRLARPSKKLSKLLSADAFKIGEIDTFPNESCLQILLEDSAGICSSDTNLHWPAVFTTDHLEISWPKSSADTVILTEHN
jgi:hypothetical protein